MADNYNEITLFPLPLKLSTNSSQISQDILSPLLRTKSII